MNFEHLKSPEFQEKLKGAATPEELLALAKEEGYELSDEELEVLAGGVEEKHQKVGEPEGPLW